MTLTALKKALNTQPFKPFRLRMPDGPGLRVPHPEFVSMTPKARTIVMWQPSGGDEYEFNIVDLNLVSDLEPNPDKGAPRKKSKR